jgi:CheY-like chemotaxis protein
MARILIIDDNKLLRETVEAILSSVGYEVVLAVDGDHGVRLFREQHFDLVLCDVFMPKKDGMETIRELRDLSADTPIVSMTGGVARTSSAGDPAEPDFLRMTNAFGATQTIAKPFSRERLLAVVRQCLELGSEPAGNA